MVRPTRDAIQSYVSITGASKPVAVRRLEEHGNNLAEALNSHFREVERSIYGNVVEDNNQVRGNESRPVPGPLPSILSAARAFRPSLLLDPNYRRNIIRQLALSRTPSPSSHTAGEATGFPVHSTLENNQIPPPRLGEGYATHSPSYGGTGTYSNDAEEEMIRAAIEASKEDFQEYSLENMQDPSSVLSQREDINREDEDIARAISMSLELEEQEREREQHYNPCPSNTNQSSSYQPRSSPVQDKREEMKQKNPIDTCSQHGHDLQNVEASYGEEWGGIPSKELEEAIMLEKALFSASHSNQSGIHIESQSPDKRLIGEEPESSSTKKKEALPIEPSVENEDAITLLVRMPDSSRHGRRFLKSDKLKHLFDFIDAAGLVQPGTYRMVRPYPRRAFSLEDGNLTFEELSLTNKQEALFLELI